MALVRVVGRICIGCQDEIQKFIHSVYTIPIVVVDAKKHELDSVVKRRGLGHGRVVGEIFSIPEPDVGSSILEM